MKNNPNMISVQENNKAKGSRESFQSLGSFKQNA